MNYPKTTLRTLSLLVGGMLVAGCMDNAVAPEMPVLDPMEAITNLSYEVVEGDGGSDEVCTFTSDGEGGEAVCGPHTLFVPVGAVSGLVDFEIVLRSEFAGASMSATSQGSTVKNDVGAAGFAVPLKFVVDYTSIESKIDDEDDLKMGWIVDGAVVEVVNSKVDEAANKVTGDIEHFSDYALIQP